MVEEEVGNKVAVRTDLHDGVGSNEGGMSVREYLSYRTFVCPWTGAALMKGGEDVELTVHNCNDFLCILVDRWLGSGVCRQLAAFREGMASVLPLHLLHSFSAPELRDMFCGLVTNDEVWSDQDLELFVHPGEGFTRDSSTFQALLAEMKCMAAADRRKLLSFVTNFSYLPIGGTSRLKALLGSPSPHNDGITVDCMTTAANGVKQPPEWLRKNSLPRARTCTGQLRIPPYETQEELSAALKKALHLNEVAPGFGAS